MSLTKLGLGTNQGPLWHRRPTDFQGTSVSVYWAALKHWYLHIRGLWGFYYRETGDCHKATKNAHKRQRSHPAIAFKACHGGAQRLDSFVGVSEVGSA